ncbi:reverse transcriptase-like protein [Intrasporangium oryzae]
MAGYGALVRDGATGEVLVELAQPLGTASNNVAEYSGLIAGLRAVLEIDAAAQVRVRMDSKLVIEQMSGRWKIKHEDMRRLALEARDLCAELSEAGGSVDFEWIPRERNKAADALSNEAMDGHSVRRVLTAPPAAGLSTDADTTASPPGRGSGGESPGAATASPPGRSSGGESPGAATASPPGRGSGGEPPGGTRTGLRLLLVQSPDDVSVTPRIVEAVRRLVGGDARVVGASDDASTAVASSLAEAVRANPDTDDAWAAPAGWEGIDARVSAAYASLVEAGGTVVVVTSRRGVLTVLSDVLGMPAERFWAIATAPGSLTGIEVWEDGSASVAFTNRTDHLA